MFFRVKSELQRKRTRVRTRGVSEKIMGLSSSRGMSQSERSVRIEPRFLILKGTCSKIGQEKKLRPISRAREAARSTIPVIRVRKRGVLASMENTVLER